MHLKARAAAADKITVATKLGRLHATHNGPARPRCELLYESRNCHTSLPSLPYNGHENDQGILNFLEEILVSSILKNICFRMFSNPSLRFLV